MGPFRSSESLVERGSFPQKSPFRALLTARIHRPYCALRGPQGLFKRGFLSRGYSSNSHIQAGTVGIQRRLISLSRPTIKQATGCRRLEQGRGSMPTSSTEGS